MTCGVGQQYRSLECVWKFTEDSAGDACNTKSIPQTVKQCKQVSCVTTTTTPIPVLRGMYGKSTVIIYFYFQKTVMYFCTLQMKAVKILPNTVGSSSPSKCAIKTSTNVNAARLAHEGRRKQKEAPFSANLRHLLRRPWIARKAHKNNFSSLTTTSTWSQLNTKRKTYKIWKQNLLFKNISKSGCEF